MRVRLAILAGAALLVAGQPLAAQPRPDVRQYVEFALGQLKARHINSARADWTTIELEAESLLVHARDTRDARKVIDHVLRRLGEKHSFIFHPEEAAEHRKNAAEQGDLPVASSAGHDDGLPTGYLRDGAVAHLTLPGPSISAGGQELFDAYATTLRQHVEELAPQARCGWIIDLRNNYGGGMWPMLWGMDPLLGDGPFGYFVARSGTIPWARTSEGIMGAREIDRSLAPAFAVRHAAAPVAVLLSNRTVSAGEMAAVSLIGREGVRTFGQPTAGYTTANVTEAMPDGARLVITVSKVADRTGEPVDGPLIPDREIPSDLAHEAAAAWLTAQCDG